MTQRISAVERQQMMQGLLSAPLHLSIQLT
jgi:hypothetical protein